MIYEYRAYDVMPGRMPDIQRRFAATTMKRFAKHGIFRPTSFSPMK